MKRLFSLSLPEGLFARGFAASLGIQSVASAVGLQGIKGNSRLHQIAAPCNSNHTYKVGKR